MTGRADLRRYLFGALALLLPWATWAQEVAAVLSSNLTPYREAFGGFREALGTPVTPIALDGGDVHLPGSPRVVVAFGSKAAQQPYPPQATVVVCMAPATPAAGGEGTPQRRVRVHMLPEPRAFVDVVRRLQPGLRRLEALTVLDAEGAYLEAMRRYAGTHGLEVRREELQDADLLPERLRRLAREHVEALWLPPDPLLITPRNFAVLKEFSRVNGVPLYVPTAGFVEAGATAAIAPGFRDVGAAAARATLDLLAGRPVPDEIFPTRIETTVNLPSARRVGLNLEGYPVDRTVGADP